VSLLGWAASILLILGWYGYPRLWGLLLNTTGTWLWSWVAFQLGMWDLFALDVILAVIQSRLLYHAVRVKFGLATAVFKYYLP